MLASSEINTVPNNSNSHQFPQTARGEVGSLRGQGKWSLSSEAPGDVAREDQDEHDDQNQAQSSAGSMAPISAVIPRGQATEEENDEDDSAMIGAS